MRLQVLSIYLLLQWLHRSAFSYGGLREREPIQSSQCSENLILGTSATNTAMIRSACLLLSLTLHSAKMYVSRVEEFIKRYVVREQESVVVTTRVKDEGNNLGCKASDKACWLAPTLEYEFAPEPGAQNTVSIYRTATSKNTCLPSCRGFDKQYWNLICSSV